VIHDNYLVQYHIIHIIVLSEMADIITLSIIKTYNYVRPRNYLVIDRVTKES